MSDARMIRIRDAIRLRKTYRMNPATGEIVGTCWDWKPVSARSVAGVGVTVLGGYVTAHTRDGQVVLGAKGTNFVLSDGSSVAVTLERHRAGMVDELVVSDTRCSVVCRRTALRRWLGTRYSLMWDPLLDGLKWDPFRFFVGLSEEPFERDRFVQMCTVE